jgi:hypothetical protein
MEDKKYPIELEVITPLCVGAGNDNDWVKGIDYVQKDGKVYVIDMQKVAAAGVDVDVLTALFLKYDEAGICQLLGSRIGELSRYVFDSPVWSANNIKTFLRTQLYDKPLVAGSSIKGSVRSALFNYLRTNEESNELVFGTMKEGTDFMRFVRIGDIEMPSTVLVNTKLFNLRTEGTEWYGGWKHAMNKTTGSYRPDGFNTLHECVQPAQKGLGNISLATATFSLLETYGQGSSPYANKKRALLNEPVNLLFQIINEVTKAYLIKERAFFEKYPAERSDELIDCIDRLLRLIPADDSSCLLKMSAGVGFHSITGDWRFAEYDETGVWTEPRNAGKKKYKSRKTAEYDGRLQLMGFVMLRALTQQEATEKAVTLQQSHNAQRNQMLDAIRQREEQRQQEIAMEQSRQRAREEDKRKQTAFQQLMEQARTAYYDGRWAEGLTLANEALTLYPDNGEVQDLVESCKKAQEIEAFRQQEQESARERFQQPLAELIKKVSSAGNLVNTTKRWVEMASHTFDKDEQTAFLDIAGRLPSKEKKKLKGRLADLAPLLGQKQVDAICKELEIL